MSSQKIGLYGITFHVGSQCESIRTWENALLSTQRSIQLSHSYGLRPRSVNIGGGFPIQHKKGVPELKEIHQIIQRHTQTWEKEKLGIRELIMEPGRFLVGTSGTLKTTIIGVSKRNGVQWVYLDCGLFFRDDGDDPWFDRVSHHFHRGGGAGKGSVMRPYLRWFGHSLRSPDPQAPAGRPFIFRKRRRLHKRLRNPFQWFPAARGCLSKR